MVNLFVSESETESVEVFAFANSMGVLIFTTDAAEVAPDSQPDTVKFVFRKPNYDDSRFIMSKAAKVGTSGEAQIDMSILQDVCFKRLLKEWNVRQDDMISPINDSTIGKLNPELVRVVVANLLGKIRI